MFHGGVKYSMDVLTSFTEVSNIPRKWSNIPQRNEIFYGDAGIFHGGVKWSTEGVKFSTKV